MSNSRIQTPQLPKGTRDFYPDAMRIQNFIFDNWRKVSVRFGYEEYEGPMFEHLELFTGKSGDEIVSQLYNFEDKGNRALALRPEMTPTLARLVIQKGNTLKKPFKWFSMPRLFRYERAQKGRLREFFQLNLDIIGTESIYAEVDLISSIAVMLFNFGLKTSDFAIGISSRKLLATYLDEIGAPDPEKIYPVLDRRMKLGPEAFRNSLLEIDLTEEQIKQIDTLMSCKDLESVRTLVHSEKAEAALKEIEFLFEMLKSTGFGDSITLDLSIVRGLAYYTGIVFEVFDKGKSMRAIAGGGRYDNLCQKLGGERVPGVGFGMGDVVLANFLADHDLLPSSHQSLDVFVATFTNDFKKVFKIANKLRDKGLIVNHPLDPAKLKKQMTQANSQGARFVVYADGEKGGEDTYEFKDLSKGEMGVGTLDEIAIKLSK